MVRSVIVGYQTKAMEANFNWWCNTFVPVGKSATELTLGDITPSSGFVFSTIDFVDDQGAVVVLNDPDVGDGVMKSYTYWNAGDAVAGVAGWYLYDDARAEYPKNDVPLKLGEAYIAACYSGEEGETLTYNGEVYKESMPYELASNFNWLGNCAPTDITLSDITVDSNFVFSTIDFVDDQGAVVVLNDPDVGDGVMKSYTYWNAGDAVAGVAGWYLYDDARAEHPKNDVVVPSGNAFIAACYSGEEDAVITLPSALK